MSNTIAVIQSILYIFLNAFIYLSAILLVFKIFRIKDSRAFIFLLLLAMLKPYSAAFKLSRQYHLFAQAHFHFLFFKTINNIFNNRITGDIESYLLFKIFIYTLISIIGFGTIFLFFQNIFCIRKIKKLKRVHKPAGSDILKLAAKYCKEMKIKMPGIYLIEDSTCGFFTSGFINNIIVLNSRIFDSFNPAEKETIILHELSHIKRKDNILNIFLYYFNLINFFNPVAYISYFLIKDEQEKDCDRMVLKYSKRPGSEIAKNILTSIIKIKNLSCGFDTVFLKTASFFSISRAVSTMKVRSRIYFLISTGKADKSNGLNIFLKSALYVFFIILLFF